ncbi:MAG: cob(I)alamin adenosyltransferase [Rhodothermales bacterium]|jgi:cob(I)alamin adenosyltransferase
MRINRVYTRGGDAGQTSLVDGSRVAKTSLRVECCGVADELNTAVGMLRAQLPSEGPIAESADVLLGVQRRLFDLGSIIATPADFSYPGMRCFEEAEVAALETQLGQWNAGLPELKSFILPGANELDARAHVARASCRRLERRLWELHVAEPLSPELLRWVNRLSDLFFVYARWLCREQGLTELLWKHE